MKKVLIGITLAGIIMSGCSSKPSGMSDNTYNAATEALKVMDDFNNGDLEYSKATAKLEKLQAKIDHEIKDENSSEEPIEWYMSKTIDSFILEAMYNENIDSASDDLLDTADQMRHYVETGRPR